MDKNRIKWLFFKIFMKKKQKKVIFAGDKYENNFIREYQSKTQLY